MLILILILVFISVALFSFQLIPEPKKVVEGEERFRLKGEKDPLLKLLYPLITKLAKYNQKLKIDDYRIKIKKQMRMGGNPGDLSPDEFIAFKELMMVVSFLIFTLIFHSLFFSLIGLIGGFFYPNLWLKERIKNRKRLITRELPDVLDLLTLSVEAGLTFDSALDRILKKAMSSPLMEEFFEMFQEIKMGKNRSQALRDMEQRVDIPDMTSFVSSLIQAAKLGTSIGTILRVQSDQMRTNRMQRAEKLAMEAPVKMLLPLIGFIFPAVFIILFGPIILQFVGGKF